MKNITETAKEWALVNAKLMTEKEFSEKNDGMTFQYFTKNHRGPSLFAWNKLMKERAEKIKTEKQVKKAKDYCSCAEEEKQGANATQGLAKVPVRLWYCKKHGNTFKHLPLEV